MTELVLQIDDTLMERLRQKADVERRAVEDVALKAIIDSDPALSGEVPVWMEDEASTDDATLDIDAIVEKRDFAAHMADPDPNNVFLRILEGAYDVGDSSLETNVSERSRAILRDEFPEYLMRRLRGQV